MFRDHCLLKWRTHKHAIPSEMSSPTDSPSVASRTSSQRVFLHVLIFS